MISKIGTKTVNPVWNEEIVFEGKTLQDFIAGRIELKMHSSVNLLRWIRTCASASTAPSPSHRCSPRTATSTPTPHVQMAPGAVTFSVAYRPPQPSEDDEKALMYSGQERVIVGKPLILRETAKLDSLEAGKVGPGARAGCGDDADRRQAAARCCASRCS